MRLESLTDIEREIKHKIVPTSSHEIAWELGDEGKSITHGHSREVKIKQEKAGSWIVHTHPADEPNMHTALPSKQDLQSLIDGYPNVPGIVIISGDYYSIVRPTKENIVLTSYDETASSEELIKRLKQMGFEIAVGKMNN